MQGRASGDVRDPEKRHEKGRSVIPGRVRYAIVVRHPCGGHQASSFTASPHDEGRPRKGTAHGIRMELLPKQAKRRARTDLSLGEGKNHSRG